MASPGMVQTARGPVAPAELGRTLAHEHVFCDFYRVTGNLDHLLNDEDLAVSELTPLVRAGGTGLVEVTTPDLGRDPEGLRRVSERTGLHVVMGTGTIANPTRVLAW
jgi:predicted metal-dependent phosphotriesterase family hydrolase